MSEMIEAARLAREVTHTALATYEGSRTQAARAALFKAVEDWERALRALSKRVAKETLH
jgi:hypothetical protein